jgi:hypothetical protein
MTQREHIRLKHSAEDTCPVDAGTAHSCVVCDLFICEICGGAEGSLLPSCPGQRLTPEEDERNYVHYLEKTGPFRNVTTEGE